MLQGSAGERNLVLCKEGVLHMRSHAGKAQKKTDYFLSPDRTFITAKDSMGHIYYLDAEDEHFLHERCFFRNKGNGYFEGKAFGKLERLHRLVMGAKPGEYLDHISRDKRDNRKSNLRFCTNSQNQANAVASVRSSTGYKGVFQNNPTAKWRNPQKPYKSSIRVRGVSHHLGYFYTIKKAKEAYDKASSFYFGEFANSL